MIKQISFDSTSSDDATFDSQILDELQENPPKHHHHSVSIKNTSGFDMSMSAVYILIQLICSCLAGVYNEYLLKGAGANTNIYVQNVLMYIDSIVCNVIVLILQGNLLTAFNVDSLKNICTFNVMIIMMNNAAIGIVTCFFLKYLNSILKTFASALELVFTAILCYILFQMPIHLNTILSIGVVSFAIYLYSMSPVMNIDEKRKPHKEHDDQLEKLIGNTKADIV